MPWWRRDKMAGTCILGPIASTKKAMEEGKELSWQRYVTLRTTALEGAWYVLDCPSTRICIHHFSKNRLMSIVDKSGILYPGISVTEEVYCDIEILNMAPFCPYYWSYNIQSRDGGRTKWRIYVFSVQSRRQKWRWMTGKILAGKDVSL
jgi:hypothetical protein